MSKIYSSIYSFLAAFMLLMFTGCTPDEVEPVEKDINVGDLVEGVAFSVTPDAQNPNLIHLRSLLPTQYQVYWEHPQGQSQDANVDLKIAFNGEYTVRFGVETRGGLVISEPYTFHIEDFCADFVTGEMWDMLTGGAGSSKTWVPDNGQYGCKQGYYSCFDPSAVWSDMTHTDGKRDWYATDKTWWEPGNSDVGITDDDLAGEMTFSLDGAAKLSVTTVVGGTPITREGLFDMNTDGHTIQAVNVDFLHAAWTDGKAKDFRNNFVILYIDENQLMIANHRDPVLSGEGDCLFCFNFVSKDWADSYVPPVVVDTPEPELPADWYSLFTGQLRYCSWDLDTENPFSYANLYGVLQSTTYTPVDAEINLNLASDSQELFELTANDNKVSGKYDVSTYGWISFDTPLGSTPVADVADFYADSDNKLRMLSYETDDLGRISEMWLGRLENDYAGNPIRYAAYHFIANFGGATAEKYKMQIFYNNTSSWEMIEGESVFVEGDGTFTLNLDGSNSAGDPCLWIDCNKILKSHPNADVIIRSILVDGVDVPFVDDDISRGYPDDDSSTQAIRRYICNPWGLAACFTSASQFHFNSRITVTVDVKFETGKPFITPAE